MKLVRAWPVIAIAVQGGACASDGGSSGTPVEATYAAEASVASSTDAAFMYAMTDPFLDPYYAFDVGSPASGTTSDASDAATIVAAGAGRYFTPKDCVQSDMDKTDVTLELEDCAGPIGLAHATGTVQAHFSMVGEDVRVELSSRDLRVNGADAVLDANGVYSMPETKKKQVAVTSHTSVTQDGKAIARDDSSTVSWNAGSKCANVKGTGTLTANDQEWAVTTDYTQCTGQCPKSGSVMLIGSPSATINFNGSSHPDYQTTDANNGTVALQCGGD